MKEKLKNIAKNLLPYSYMSKRREGQKADILKSQTEPLVYNKNGDIKRVFYIKDTLCQHTPYTLVLGQNPEGILWDRYNIGLPIQFYTHEAIFENTNPNAKKCFGMFFESESIRPKDFRMAMDNPEVIKKYDKIFTFSEELLNKYDNAVFAPASGLWYGTEDNGGKLDTLAYEKKTKNMSVVASNKQGAYYHKVRLSIAKQAKETGKVDAYGAFCGNRIAKKADALTPYRYSIVVENDVKPLYFTEKILDCFASMTIPLYVGATDISKYFNIDGIICIDKKDYDNVENIITGCSEKEYENRIEAIKDNFERVKKFRCIEDYIINEYKDEFNI